MLKMSRSMTFVFCAAQPKQSMQYFIISTITEKKLKSKYSYYLVFNNNKLIHSKNSFYFLFFQENHNIKQSRVK